MTQTPKQDSLYNLKYLGYSLAKLPTSDLTLKDYLRYAKFYLSVKTGTLLKDPIWDEYTAEELLTEFFAHQFETNTRFLEDFEKTLNTADSKINDFSDWADKEIEKQKEELNKKLEGFEDHISFNPNVDIGE